MKSWGQQIFFLSALLLSLAWMPAFAQDAGMSDVDVIEDATAAEEKVVFTPGEDLRFVPAAGSGVLMAKDSMTLQMHDFPMQRAAQKPAEKPADKQNSKSKDDSILTFNFLYYIIQKYKLQDVID
jgi:hypothetical protein